MDKSSRFIVVHEEGGSLLNEGKRMIVVDKLTGVNYLWLNSGYAGGLTPLLDKTGKPIVSNDKN